MHKHGLYYGNPNLTITWST